MLLTVGLGSPQAAVSAEPALIVQADVSGSATVDFAGPVELDAQRWSLSGTGTYKVALLDRVVKDRVAAGYNLIFSDVPGLQAKPLMLGGPGRDEPVVVPAGRYRIHIASNAPARLRVPIMGHGSRALHIKKKSRIQARLDRGTPSADALPLREAGIRSNFLLGDVVTYKSSRWELSQPAGPYTSEIRDCITTPDGECAAGLVPGVGVSHADGTSTYSRHEYWDTFDHSFKGAASAVTEYEGMERPTSFAQLLVAFPVG